MADEDHPDQSAAEAFEHLRSEVALLRRAVEGMAAASVESGAPDYSPTLAGLRKAIDGVGRQVEALAANPPVTSLQMAAGLAAAAVQGRSEGQREIAQAKGALEKGVRDLAAAAGDPHRSCGSTQTHRSQPRGCSCRGRGVDRVVGADRASPTRRLAAP